VAVKVIDENKNRMHKVSIILYGEDFVGRVNSKDRRKNVK